MSEITTSYHSKRTRWIPSLFVKIFAWFWVAMALISLASLLSALATESHPFFIARWLRFPLPPPVEHQSKQGAGPFLGRWIGSAASILKVSGETAAGIYEKDGSAALVAYVERLEKETRIRVFLMNSGGEELTGGVLPEEVSKFASDLKHPVEMKRVNEVIFIAQRIQGPGKGGYGFVAQLPAGQFPGHERELPFTHILVILLTGGGVCYWLARYITTPIRRLRAATRRLTDGDLTVRVSAALGRRNDEIMDLGRDFDEMADRIESLMKAQKRLLRDISHEFRSPLTRLMIALEIARTREGQEAEKAFVRIELEAERLNELIGQLLTLARLESGAKTAHDEPIGMGLLLDEIIADAVFEAQQHGCEVSFQTREDCTVSGNRGLIRSAIENVLRNAVRFTAQGSEVLVSLSCRITEEGRMAIVKVRDHGPGVPEESLSSLFAPFYRVGDDRDRTQGGTGLGLAITEKAIKRHGGKVEAVNSPGGGLMITITLAATACEELK